MWYVYIIQSGNGKLYTGITTDIDRRLKEHQSPGKGARFFNISPAINLQYIEPVINRSQASKREWFIKSLSRKEKIDLIQNQK